MCTPDSAGAGEVAMDSGISEEFERKLILEILTIRDKFEVVPYFQHLPSPPSLAFQCDVSKLCMRCRVLWLRTIAYGWYRIEWCSGLSRMIQLHYGHLI